ncbi:hypothetical protein MK805_15505 [Shimazuella sp. AN120528]|uniref:ABC-three component system middle component 2 n=1 Tax=Shimazuella soli TaxID=1892854 RepID=UPI001F0F16E8|nr:ABC-three component system middle component 2 [Shimazuella soli]MCH5586349.1 hypothetical protein [Shimazuella soli]
MNLHSLDQSAQIRLDAMRILILVSAFLNKKSFILDLDKIMLYDFYLKFPNVMIPESEYIKVSNLDFDGYYSYYHWKPDRGHYQICLGFLVGKKLIIKTIKRNVFSYSVSHRGESIVNELNSKYAMKLVRLADYISKKISLLSEAKVEANINLCIEQLKMTR